MFMVGRGVIVATVYAETTERHVRHRDVEWDVREIVIPGNPQFSFWNSWERGEFEPETLEAIDRFVVPGTAFVDCGAWLGNVSLWAARIAGTHVVSIEPDPVAASVLRKNVAANYTN